MTEGEQLSNKAATYYSEKTLEGKMTSKEEINYSNGFLISLIRQKL